MIFGEAYCLVDVVINLKFAFIYKVPRQFLAIVIS